MTYFECYADEVVLRAVGFSSKDLEHSFGRSKVCHKLSKDANSIGFVDEDPNKAQDPYMRYLFTLPPIYRDEHLLCFTDIKSKNKLLVVRPNLEGWIIKLVTERKIDLKRDYGLPKDWKELHDVLMLNRNIRKREIFKNLVEELLNHSSMIKLKELVQ